MHCGTVFAGYVLQYLGKVIEGVQQTEKPISFGCAVTFKLDGKTGLILATMRAKAPKVPVKDLDSVQFTLQLDDAAQLEMLFAGTPEEMLVAIETAEAEGTDGPGDAYQPGDNAEETPDEPET